MADRSCCPHAVSRGEAGGLGAASDRLHWHRAVLSKILEFILELRDGPRGPYSWRPSGLLPLSIWSHVKAVPLVSSIFLSFNCSF